MGFIRIDGVEHYSFDGIETECGLSVPEDAEEVHRTNCPSGDVMCFACWESLQDEEEIVVEERIGSKPIWR